MVLDGKDRDRVWTERDRRDGARAESTTKAPEEKTWSLGYALRKRREWAKARTNLPLSPKRETPK